MWMNEWQETFMARAKPSALAVHDAAVQIVFGRIGNGIQQKIQLAPLLGDALEHRFELTRLLDVERHENLATQLFGQRFHIGFCTVV
jgi:hypothetical protein